MKPVIAPDLRTELLAAVPRRLRRRLDTAAAQARDWAWTTDGPAWTVAAGAQTVRIDGSPVLDAGQVSCDCLIGPRCLHLAAVLAGLDTAEQAPPAPAATEEPAVPDEPPPADPAEPVKLTKGQRTTADLAWRTGAALLADGAARAGAPVRSALRHTAESARRAKLPLLSAVATRVATGLGELAEDRSSFRLPDFTGDVHLMLSVADRLRRDPTNADVGIARRPYTGAAAARYTGVCTERIVTESGYAGVVTYLADEDGRIWTVSDVRPGDATRVNEAYRNGEWLPSPDRLCRTSFYARGLTMSADGRLGRAAAADIAPERTGVPWTAPELDRLWTEPVGDQLRRALAATSREAADRRAGDDLVFAEVTVDGLHGGTLTGFVDGLPVSILAPGDEHPTVPNVRRLAAHAGTSVRTVLRVHPTVPRAARILAVAPPEGVPLPDAWHGRANVTLDELPGAMAGSAGSGRAGDPDPLTLMTRSRERAVLSGRGAFAAASLATEIAGLRRNRMPAAADLLDRLTFAARRTRTLPTGEAVPAGAEELAAAWVACGGYETAARQALMRRLWGVEE